MTIAFVRSRTQSAVDPSRVSRWRVGALLTIAASFASAGAWSQASNCPFDVSRDTVTSPTARTPRFAHDGVLMTRFALGVTGPALYDALSTDTARFVGEGNTGSVAGNLDIDGDGVFSATDATIAARYIAGFRNDVLVAGLAFNTAASRKTGAQVMAYINGGCAIPAVTATMQRHAARLLQQGTFGATLNEINRVAALGADPNAMTNAWLTEQFAKTRSQYASYSQQIIDENKTAAFDWRCNGANKSWGCAYAANTPAFYKRAMEGEDQLRQRVTNALWQTLVVSIANNTVLDSGVGLSSYWDMISENAFGANTTNAAGQPVGNFRKTLKDMTLHPAMGIYLDMLGSTAEVPNENYARELLQLFSVGTVMLNLDGTPQLVNGKTIPTYTEGIVQGFARAFTGWHWMGSSGDSMYDTANGYWRAWWFYYYPDRDWTKPMEPWAMRRCPQNGKWPPGSPDNASGGPAPCYSNCNIQLAACSFPSPHNRDAKTLLQYSGAPYATIAANPPPTYPADQNYTQLSVRNEVIAAAKADLEKAIDNVFYHPNVGPFIARQMIQRLVTSNPTPGYVSRVATKFNDNGSGIRGDMKAVVTQIFLDSEARDVNVAGKHWFGKLREPVIKFVHLHRAFNARETQKGFYDIWDTGSPETLGQSAMRPPSVFNYYSPDFGPSGPLAYPLIRAVNELGTRKNEPLLGPEFEITNTSTVAGFSDFSGWAIYRGFAPSYDGGVQLRWQPDYSRYIVGAGALADSPQSLIDELDILLTAGNLKPAFKANLVAMANGITRGNVDEQRQQRFEAVFWQIIHSADYAIQR